MEPWQSKEYFREERDVKRNNIVGLSINEVLQVIKARDDVILFQKSGLPSAAAENRLKRAREDFQPYAQQRYVTDESYKRHKKNLEEFGFSVSASRIE